MINEIKEDKTIENTNNYFTLKSDISQRVEELENYFDDNFGNPRMLCLEKGIFNLKKLLFYNPDAKNELEAPDNEHYRGLSLDMSKITGANGLSKSSTTKPKMKVSNTNNKMIAANKYASAKKGNVGNDYKNSGSGKKGTKISADKGKGNEGDGNVNDGNYRLKRKLIVRLTEDEYKLYVKIRDKRNETIN